MKPQLKHAGRFTTGQTIRGYDFYGRKDCFLQGQVIDPNFQHERGFACYRVLITQRVMADEPILEEVGGEGYIPHEVSMMEWDGRIELAPVPQPR